MSKTGPTRAVKRALVKPLDNIGQLYDRHAALFGLDGIPLKKFVLEGLAKQANEPDKLRAALQAARMQPARADLHYDLALLLEQNGYHEDALHERLEIARLDPASNENKIAIGRIYERLGTYDIEGCYKRLFFGNINSSSFLLAVSRYMATANKTSLNEMTLSDIKLRVEESLIHRPDNVSFHLAKGFIYVAEGNIENARLIFLRATFLAELPVPLRRADSIDGSGMEDGDSFDSWSLQYARTFLVNPVPSDLSSVVIFPPLDPCRFALVRGRLALSQGLVFSALEQFWSAVSKMPEVRPAHAQVVFNGFRIVLHEGRFYAVPLSVRNFIIIDGIVVRIAGSIEDHKLHVGDAISPGWRKVLRPISQFIRFQVIPTLARIPILGFIGRQVFMLARWLYIRMQAAQGVLIDTDVVALRERISRIRAEIVEHPAGSPTAAHRKAA